MATVVGLVMLDWFGLPQPILSELNYLGSILGLSLFLSGSVLFCANLLIDRLGHGAWGGLPAFIMRNEYKWFFGVLTLSIVCFLMLPNASEQHTLRIVTTAETECELTSRTPKELIDMQWDNKEHPPTCVRVKGVVQDISDVKFGGPGPIVTLHVVIDVSVGIDSDGSVQIAKIFVSNYQKVRDGEIQIGDELNVTGIIHDVHPTYIEVAVYEIS